VWSKTRPGSNRPLEDRGLLRRVLCRDDRRGNYTEHTDAGHELLAHARPTHDGVLEATLAEAEPVPELAPMAAAVEALPWGAALSVT
jgi:hypothetical protein